MCFFGGVLLLDLDRRFFLDDDLSSSLELELRLRRRRLLRSRDRDLDLELLEFLLDLLDFLRDRLLLRKESSSSPDLIFLEDSPGVSGVVGDSTL